MPNPLFAEEAPLYELLDRRGIPFRTPMGDLVEMYGTRPDGWSKGGYLCEFRHATPLIEGLAGPVYFPWSDRNDRSTAMWPAYLSAYVRRTANSAENFGWANRCLTELLGPGTAISTATTSGRRWQFGRAQVETWMFVGEGPRAARRTGNRRLQKVAGASTECLIAITPNWSPLPTPTEAAALASYAPFEELKVFDRADPRQTYVDRPMGPRFQTSYLGYSELSPITRSYRVEARGMALGYGFDAGNTFLFRVALPGIVHALAVDRIDDVHVENVLPAKGPGGSSLSVRYQQPGRLRPSRLTLAHGAQPGDVDQLAERLARKLDLPVSTSELPDY